MPLTLNLTSEIEQYLSQKAREKGLWLSQVWWVKCILRYILKSEGVERTTKTQRTQRSIDHIVS
ncbi:hypothetical protein [Microcystis aeruginosa]|uniref:hypothetical protein n=1 Tax=Microcystis aeruginosa TaxID=1126 RepID=UPI0002FB3035|nr:hypothetical protein [Microcystis aeruginosa]